MIDMIFSLSISAIISNARRQARESAKMMYRTELLLDNSRRMRRVDNIKDILKELSGQVLKLMNLPVGISQTDPRKAKTSICCIFERL